MIELQYQTSQFTFQIKVDALTLLTVVQIFVLVGQGLKMIVR